MNVYYFRFLGVKQPGREFGHSPHPTSKLWKRRAVPLLLLYAFKAQAETIVPCAGFCETLFSIFIFIGKSLPNFWLTRTDTGLVKYFHVGHSVIFSIEMITKYTYFNKTGYSAFQIWRNIPALSKPLSNYCKVYKGIYIKTAKYI